MTTYAQALKGPAAFEAIQDALGVSLPEGTEIPEVPEGGRGGACNQVRRRGRFTL
ncbi:MAG: hypothetical protein OEU26_23565 [Candidatus Tectomicrobia bacterium]|nr:hypothetical protein [Candidatus Tectomicrobia bacterium]